MTLCDLQLKSRSSGDAVPALQGLTKYVLRPGPMDREVSLWQDGLLNG